MKIKRILILVLMSFIVLAITRIERYSLYIYHLDESYISLNTEGREMVASVPISTCDDHVCVESLVEVYYNDQNRVYFMLASVSFEPLKEASIEQYTTLHQVRIDAELDETVDYVNRAPRIINALMTNPLLDSHVGLDVHYRNALGQRDFTEAEQKVGYRMTSSLSTGYFRGVFDFYEVVASKSVATYFVYESNDLVDQHALNSVQVEIDYRQYKPQFLWFSDTTRETITHTHVININPLPSD